ncbi:MAG: hypothetical protein GYB51_18760 [Rhodobacteraceae bacterium]|nr:hypothetical protein [Paracoccaceae bacterium]
MLTVLACLAIVGVFVGIAIRDRSTQPLIGLGVLLLISLGMWLANTL